MGSFENVLGQSAQSDAIRVTGTLVDTIGRGIDGVTVRVSAGADTVAAISDNRGRFSVSVTRIPDSLLKIHAAHLGYAPFRKNLRLSADATFFALGSIELKARDIELDAVQVDSRPDVYVSGDTTFFETRHIQVAEGAFTEELVRRLPGMSLDAENRLFYHGKEITHARLNGIDFFGGNILLALQNLPADLILRLQLIEDHGIHHSRNGLPGVAPKQVLNLEVDDDHTQGKFTQGKAGYGSSKTYAANAGGYQFNKAKQAAILLGVNNVADPKGYVASSKIHPNLEAGTNTITGISGSYANKLTERDEHYLLYAFNNTENDLRSSSMGIQTYADERTLRATTDRNRLTRSRVHEFGGWYQPAFHWRSNDGRTVFHVNPLWRQEDFVTNTENTDIQEFYERGAQTLSQLSAERSEKEGSKKAYQADVNLRHTLNNKQVLILELQGGMRKDQGREHLVNELSQRDAQGRPSLDSLIRQEIADDDHRSDARLNARYSIPFEGAHSLGLSATIQRIHQRGTRGITDVLGQPTPIDSLGSASRMNQQETGLGMSWNGRLTPLKLNYTLGAQVYHLWQQFGDDHQAGSETERTGLYAVPSLRLSTGGNRLRINVHYKHRVQQPSHAMLNPVADHRVPQRIVTGNPALKAGLEHELLFEFTEMPTPQRPSIKTYRIGTVYHTNRIVQDFLVVPLENGLVRQELRYRNLSGDVALQGGFNSNLPGITLVDPVKIQLNMGSTGSVGRERYYEAGRLKESLLANMNLDLSASHFTATHHYQLGTSYAVYHHSSANALGTNTVHTLRTSLTVSQQLWSDVKLTGHVRKLFNWGYQGPANINPLGINFSLEGALYKSALTWSVAVHDLLGQGTDPGRTISRNEFVDYKTNALGRYALAALNWRLGTFGGSF